MAVTSDDDEGGVRHESVPDKATVYLITLKLKPVCVAFFALPCLYVSLSVYIYLSFLLSAWYHSISAAIYRSQRSDVKKS